MLRRFALFRFPLFLEADDGKGDGGASDVDSQDNDNDGAGTTANPAATGKTFTQADVDRIAERERKRGQAAAKKEFEDAQAKANMTETDRLKAEADAAKQAAQQAIATANLRAITAEARVQALTLGVKPERVAAALKLADLADVTVDDNGEPDTDAINKAVLAMLGEYPEFKTATASGNVGGGSNPASGGGKEPTLAEQYAAAQKAGNVPLMVALNRQMFEQKQKR